MNLMKTFFICKCSNTKGLNLTDLPVYYQNAILAWATFQSRLHKSDKSSILNERLLGNNKISVRNTPFFIQILIEVILK